MAGELILIIEDNEVNRVLVRACCASRAIRRWRRRVLRRVTREEAFADPDGLPSAKMNGIEALQTLRADGATNSIPVIAVTASAMPEDRKKFLAAGFDAEKERIMLNVSEGGTPTSAIKKKP
jgi:CheY-like chemotaxis protein